MAQDKNADHEDKDSSNNITSSNNEIELLTTELRVENKRFYFNLKENQKGRFLKIAEVSGGRSTIIIPQSGWNEFRNMLDNFIEEKTPLRKRQSSDGNNCY